MKKLLCLLLLITLPAFAENAICTQETCPGDSLPAGSYQLARMNPYVAGSGGAAASCSATTDYVGDKTDRATSSTGSANYIICNKPVQATQSSGCTAGNLVAAVVKHNGTGEDNVKAAVFTDASGGTAESPKVGDTIVGDWVAISSSSTQLASAAASGAITIGNYYWVCVLFDATTWDYEYGAGSAGDTYYISSSYDTPPSNLAGTWSSYDRNLEIYFTIGP